MSGSLSHGEEATEVPVFVKAVLIEEADAALKNELRAEYPSSPPPQPIEPPTTRTSDRTVAEARLACPPVFP
jgi:hypothetical protein